MTGPGFGQTSLFPPEPAPDPLLCWLWLAGTLGAGSQRAGAVLDAFGGAQEAWEARDTDAFAAAAGPAAVQRACLPDNTPEHYRAFARRCAARRIRILPYDDPDYPLAFSRISDMPLVLYCTGDPRCSMSLPPWEWWGPGSPPNTVCGPQRILGGASPGRGPSS